MTTTRPATRLSAPDLRNALCLSTQPALLTSDEEDGLIVDLQFGHMVAYLRDECGVSLRRLDNALATVAMPAAARRQLRAAWGA
jgi:hypothetical protein